jgi:hypothetical protein
MCQPHFVILERRKPHDSANVLRSHLVVFLNFFALLLFSCNEKFTKIHGSLLLN